MWIDPKMPRGGRNTRFQRIPGMFCLDSDRIFIDRKPRATSNNNAKCNKIPILKDFTLFYADKIAYNRPWGCSWIIWIWSLGRKF
jgi:hypothetical protein